MGNKLKYLFLFFGMWFSLAVYAQRDLNMGVFLSGELDKRLNDNWNLSVSEELRLMNAPVGFERSVTSAGVDYAFLHRKIKMGAYYSFLYLYNNNHYFEPRHRYYFNLSYRESIGRYTLSWRGRVQGTYRDENRGMYKINPKYVLRNKFQIDYSFWGRPWKPFLSCDLSNELNNPMGNELTRIRYEAGTSWRLNRTDFMEFFVRFDQSLNAKDPFVLALGIGYKLKL